MDTIDHTANRSAIIAASKPGNLSAETGFASIGTALIFGTHAAHLVSPTPVTEQISVIPTVDLDH
jgi:hypothetical protein